MSFIQQIAVDGGGNGDRKRYKGSEAADRPWGEEGLLDGKGSSSHSYKDNSDGGRGYISGAGSAKHFSSSQLQQEWASNSKLLPSLTTSTTTTSSTTTRSNSFKSEQLTNRDNSNNDVDDQYIDYYYNNRPWWERATGGGRPGLRADRDIFPQRKHHGDREPGSLGTYPELDKKHPLHLLTKSNEHYSSSIASDFSTRGSNRFSQSRGSDYSVPLEEHRSFSRTFTRAKRQDYLKDKPESNGLFEDNLHPTSSVNNKGIHSGSSQFHSESKDQGLNVRKSLHRSSQSTSSSSSLSDFISNWTSTNTNDNSSRLSSHDPNTLSHDFTTTDNTTSVITNTTTQDFNSTYHGASSSIFYNNGSSGNRTESLFVDSSYELSTEFPGYISPQNISFDEGSIPLALEHMFNSNFSGSVVFCIVHTESFVHI